MTTVLLAQLNGEASAMLILGGAAVVVIAVMAVLKLFAAAPRRSGARYGRRHSRAYDPACGGWHPWMHDGGSHRGHDRHHPSAMHGAVDDHHRFPSSHEGSHHGDRNFAHHADHGHGSDHGSSDYGGGDCGGAGGGDCGGGDGGGGGD